MSRYTDLSPLALAVYEHIKPRSSMRPISMGDVLRLDVLQPGAAQSADIPNAVQALLDARLITSMRHTVGDTTHTVFWPTGLKPITAPSLEEIRMASESKNSQLARLILKHGPISGTDLAAKAHEAGMNCPTKNIQGILAGHLTRGEIILKKRDGLNWYMTTNQAENDGAGHVMSAPVAQHTGAKQSEAEIPVNETAIESAELAEARRTIQSLHDSIDGMLSDWTDICQALDVSTHEEALQAIQLAETQLAQRNREIHTLKNDVAGANLVLSQLASKLNVEKFEDVPGAFDELTQALCTRAMQPEPAPGRLALITYCDNDADLQFLEPYVTEEDASQVALNQVNGGTNERCTLIRVLGEARRPRATWQPLAATLHGEHQEAA